MFCVNCGASILDEQPFCGNCGQPVKHPATAAAPPPPPPRPVHAAPPPPPPPPRRAASGPPAAVSGGGHCNWCGAEVDPGQSACSRCGASFQPAAAPAASGWTQLPPRKDMAKLQFGNSSCQIEGVYVPVADMNLAAGDSVYFSHHVLLWKDPQVNVTNMSLKGAWKRMFAGLPLIMTQAEGPGHIAFSKDDPGELIPVALQPGQSIDVREHMLLAATSNVAYDWFNSGIWFQTGSGKETETHYPVGHFVDRFTSPQTPGLLLLHAGGNIFVRDLAHGQTILVKPTALVFKSPTVGMQIHFEQPNMRFTTWGSWGNRYLWLRLTGPGRVAIQSVFESLEGESRGVTGCSNATATRW